MQSGIMRLKEQIAGMEEFVAVADAGSFAAAAERLGCSASGVGKAVARYEERLGVRLFARTTRRMTLTAAGEQHLEDCRRLLEALISVQSRMDDERDALSGSIRFGAPVAYGRLRVIPHLARFTREHPAVRLDVHLDDRVVDPIRERFDLFVRIGPLIDSDLVATRVDTVHLGAFAADDYLDSTPPIRHPRDLSDHERLAFVMNNGQPLDFRFERGNEKHELGAGTTFRCTEAEGVLAASIAGLGIAYLPTFLAAPAVATGAVRPVLPEWQIEALPVHLLRPQRQFVPRRTTALAEHVKAGMRASR